MQKDAWEMTRIKCSMINTRDALEMKQTKPWKSVALAGRMLCPA